MELVLTGDELGGSVGSGSGTTGEAVGVLVGDATGTFVGFRPVVG